MEHLLHLEVDSIVANLQENQIWNKNQFKVKHFPLSTKDIFFNFQMFLKRN